MANENEPQIYLLQSSQGQSKPSIIRATDKDIEYMACLQDGDEVNRNRKIYPCARISEALQHEAVQDQLRRRCWYGEANHPLHPDMNRQLWLDMKNVSHTILDVTQKNNKFVGRILTWREGEGLAQKGAIEQGGILAFSMRGIHKLIKDPNDRRNFLVAALRIFAYDWVPFPSHRSATMIAANESAEEMLVTTEALEAVLASEGAGPLGVFSDFLGSDITQSKLTSSGISFGNNEGAIIGVTAKRKITQDIMRELLR
jgi:hypothetical protein